MSNTPGNDAPYVLGTISDTATADYKGYAINNDPSAFGGSSLNPIVRLDDGSFLVAFRVTAPTYVHNFNLTAGPSGTISLGAPGGVAAEFNFYNVIAAAPGSVHYVLSGRDAANAPVSIELTPINGKIVITEAIRANFAPNSGQSLIVSGLSSGSPLGGQELVDMTRFYDTAAPTALVQALSLAGPAPGTLTIATAAGLVESFTLQNTAAWTTGATSYRLVIQTQEPLDLTGLAGTPLQANVFTGLLYQTVITVTPASGVVAVPQAILEQLQSHPGSVALSVSGAVTGASAQAQVTVELPTTTITEGLYVQHFDAQGNPLGEAARVDSATSPLIAGSGADESTNFHVSHAADGTLVASWVGDSNLDGTPDTLYVRHLDASGVPSGATTALSGLSADGIKSIAGLYGMPAVGGVADGGYAIAYNVTAAQSTSFANGNALPAGNFAMSTVSGQLDHFQLTQFTPGANPLTANVSGETSAGGITSIQVALVNGGFSLTDAQRSVFAPDAHLSVTIGGLVGGSAVSAALTTRDIYDFASGSTLATLNRAVLAGGAGSTNGSNPDISITSGQGQIVSFHINSLTAGVVSGVPETIGYRLTLQTSHPIDTTGLTLVAGSTANLLVNGLYQTSIIATRVGDTVDVPASVLAQFPGDGMRAILGISGLGASSPVNVDITIRHPTVVEPGVYTQMFGANGVAEGAAQRIDDADASLAHASPADQFPGFAIDPLASGGYRVTWLADTNGDGNADSIVSREFTSTGSATGTALSISAANMPGVAAAAAAGADIATPAELDLVQLGTGGFAALVQVNVPPILSNFVNTTATGAPLLISPPQGRLDSVFINSATPSAGGLHYYVMGADSAGVAHSVEVFPVDGRISIPATLAAEFAPDSRLLVRVEGLQAGSQFQAGVGAADIWNYGAASTTSTLHFASTVAASTGIAGSLLGEVTAFHVASATAAPGQTPSYLLVISSSTPIATGSIGLPAQTLDSASGTWQVVVPITLDPAGNYAIPASLLSLTEQAGAGIALVALNLQPGSAFNVDITVRHPTSTVAEGLFVQLFDSAGVPTGDLVRVDDAASQILYSIDYSQSSIQSDGHGGFVVTWKADPDNDAHANSLVMRHFDSAGHVTGPDTVLSTIPDRVYSEDTAVTLYTSGIFADPDPADTLTFSATGLPVGLTINAATGVISGSAAQSGLFNVTVTATDSGGLSASSTFQVYVVNTDNDAPTTAAAPESNSGPADHDITGTLLPGFDLDGDALTFAAGAASHGSVSIDPNTGDYTFTPDAGYIGDASFSYTVSDGSLSSATKTVTLSVVTPNAAPTALSFANAVAATPENGGQVKVADIVVTDDGYGTNNLTLSGADAAKFAVIGNALYFNGGGNFEGQNAFDVTVTATDPDFPGSPVSQAFHLALSDVNEAPTTLSLTNTIAVTPENGGQVKVADIVVTDDALGTNTLSLTGADAGSFALIGNALYFIGGGDFEAKAAYDVNVVATDLSLPGAPVSQSFHLILSDVNEAPTAVSFANAVTVTPENGGQVKVADIVVTDDALGTNGLTLSGADAAKFSIIGTALYFTGGGDFEGQNAYDVIVTAKDAAFPASSASQAFHLALSDVAETKAFAGTAQGDNLAINPLSIDNWTVDGKAGADVVSTGAGNDSIDGGAGNDLLSGGGGLDTLLGGAGSDTLNGGDGNDLINGGTSSDIMTGGAGRDTFVFALTTDSVAGAQADHITDFSVADDVIDLSAIDANTKLKGDQAFAWIGSAAFSGAAGELRYDVVGGSAHIFGDVNGDKKADFEIVLDNVPSLPVTHDFLIL